MQVFKLSPIEAALKSHHWRASTLAPVTVWVRAENEVDAREKLTRATIIATRVVPGAEMPMAPWKDFGLVSCIADTSREVAEGVILTASGDTLEIDG